MTNISWNQGRTYPLAPHPNQKKTRFFPVRENILVEPLRPTGLKRRKGPRPRTMRGPLHVQCNGHGDPNFLHLLLEEVLTWPHVESANGQKVTSVRIAAIAAASDPSAFLTGREFARVLLGAPTIYLALPFECAHWAVFRGWAEPHYLRSYGMMPVSAVVVYTPRDQEELKVCSFLFSESYHFACKLTRPAWPTENL